MSNDGIHMSLGVPAVCDPADVAGRGICRSSSRGPAKERPFPSAATTAQPPKPWRLTAFGRQWSEAATVRGGVAEFLAPEVRVPVVFHLTPPNKREAVLGELVVYPDRPVPWQKELQVASVGAPDWFEGWSEAIGLPVRRFKTIEAAEAGHWPRPGKFALMILGKRPAATTR